MKPAFATLKKNYHSSEPSSTQYRSAADLYSDIGYDVMNLIKQNPGYQNTCATRMSMALIKSGVPVNGRLKIKAGPYKGKAVETGAKLLADHLSGPAVLGKPELIMAPSKAALKIGSRSGVVFFWKITGYDGGHIDLLESSSTAKVCHSHCYFDCKEVWFWALT